MKKLHLTNKATVTKKVQHNVSFIDLNMLLLCVFILITVILITLVNPPTKKEDAPNKAELIIVVEWNKDSSNDIDTWLLSEHQQAEPMYFKRKNLAPFHLDRDDLGSSNDTYITVSGETQVIRMNREVTTMRGWAPSGEYFVNIHYYSQHSIDRLAEDVHVIAATINPYKIIYEGTVTLSGPGQEQSVFSFIIEDEKVVEVTEKPEVLFIRRFLQRQGTFRHW